MIRNTFTTMRGFITAVIVIAAISYVVTNPTRAGTNVADAFHTVVGWGEAVISAVITFFHGVSG